MNGIVVIDKPEGTSSHGIVLRSRAILKTAKTGHLGTLDPMATGVLPICVGQATRLGQFISSVPKEYVGELRFGFATTTYDREGDPTTPEVLYAGGLEAVVEAAVRLTGTISQTPPPFSAKKIDGKRAYKLARRGKPVEPPPVDVMIDVFEITGFADGIASFRVVCSPGTYIRSLAHDMGRALGCGAHLISLRRLRSGPFTIDQAQPLHKVSAANLIPLENLLGDWPRIDVSGEEERRIAHGNPVASSAFPEGTLTRIFNKQGEFIAVASIEKDWAHPKVVLVSPF